MNQRFVSYLLPLHARILCWSRLQWQRKVVSPTKSYHLSFPPDDLMVSLIVRLVHYPRCHVLPHSSTQDHYFTHDHLTRPILHRPTFEGMVQRRLHEKDQYFGGLVLTVCACGSRWSDDPRTRTKDDLPGSAGWLYYEQVHRLPRPMSEPVSLVRLQLFNVNDLPQLETTEDNFVNSSCFPS